jgi:hypothetical protein
MEEQDDEITICVECPSWALIFEGGKLMAVLGLFRIALAFALRGVSVSTFMADGLPTVGVLFCAGMIISSSMLIFIRYRLTNKRLVIFTIYKNNEMRKKCAGVNKDFFRESELFSVKLADNLYWKYTSYVGAYAILAFGENSNRLATGSPVRIRSGLGWYFLTLWNPMASLVIHEDGEIARLVKSMATPKAELP